MLIDSHAHLDFEDFEKDLDGVVARAREAGLERIVCVGLWRRPGDFGNALALAARDPSFFSATAGIHPHEAVEVPPADWEELARLARDPRVVAIGEMGLDFHYDHSPRPVQEEAFRRSLRLAREVAKPIVLHVREADETCLRCLREEGIPAEGGVVHCFTGDAAAARAYLDLGLHLSVSGIVTFRTAEPIREAVRITPRDRLLVETDSPFLAPIPFRGKRNEPAYVAYVAARVAEIWGATPEEVGRTTTENVRRLFRLP
ncbi:MAG TPA: TatD family hydrolase [Anaeromyxobacteraceae bacterium]|nr:TatD family hydrolase [Anaeromyxobacteraceae bacterium]